LAKILITGGSGYLGSILCEKLLDEGHHVTVLDNLMFNQQSLFALCANPGFDFFIGDARNPSDLLPLLKEAEYIIPLAAIVGAPACSKDPYLAQTVNVDSISTLLNARGKDQKIIFPTTNSGYGTQSGDEFCTEETPMEPVSLYGKTKVEAESLLLESENTITLRLATVFGISPRMRLDLLVNHFVHAAVTQGYLTIFEKEFKRNYIHIRDVADCFTHSIDNFNTMVGEPYNVGLEEANLSKEELALKIKQHVKNFYIHFSEIGQDPDKRNYIVSNLKLKNAGFEAKRSLDDGIKELIKGYKMLGRGNFSNV
jgi:nucleoside-diphosphate-sugar epimerase